MYLNTKQGGKNMEGKKWYASKRVWSITGLFICATLTLFAKPAIGILSPEVVMAINEWLLSISSGLGVGALLSPAVPITK